MNNTFKFGISEDEKKELEKQYLGKKIKIIRMEGEPQYSDKVGIIEKIDDIGQLHGTWGGCAIVLPNDKIEIIG